MVLTKEQLFGMIKKETSLSDGELEKIWEEKLELMKKRKPATEEALLSLTIEAVRIFFHKQLYSRKAEEEIEFIYLGHSNISDFGAQKHYDSAKMQYNKENEKAFRRGIVDLNGNPLWSAVAGNLYRTGIIDPQKEKRRTIFGIGKRESDDTWKPATISMSDKVLELLPSEKGKLYKTLVNVGKNTSEKFADARLQLFSTPSTVFTLVGNAPEIIPEMIKKYMRDYLVSYNSIPQRLTNTTKDEFVVFKTSCMEYQPSAFSDIMWLSGFAEDLEETIAGYVSKGLLIDVREGAQDVIFIGRPRMQKRKDKQTNEETESIAIDLYGFFVTFEGDYVAPQQPIGNKGNEIVETQVELIEDSPTPQSGGNFQMPKTSQTPKEPVKEQIVLPKVEKIEGW